MTNDELIRQGNVLIAAVRAGKVGLNEDELKQLQGFYTRGTGLRQLTRPFVGFVFGLLLFFFGVYSTYVEAPAHINVYKGATVQANAGNIYYIENNAALKDAEAEDRTNDQLTGIGFLLMIGSVGYGFVSWRKMKASSRKYVEVVTRVYRKLGQEKAA